MCEKKKTSESEIKTAESEINTPERLYAHHIKHCQVHSNVPVDVYMCSLDPAPALRVCRDTIHVKKNANKGSFFSKFTCQRFFQKKGSFFQIKLVKIGEKWVFSTESSWKFKKGILLKGWSC